MNEQINSATLSTLAYLKTRPDEDAVSIIITPDSVSCEKAFNNIVCLKKETTKVLMLPEWDSAPEYQNSPDQEIQAQRLSSLYSIKNADKDTILVTSIPAIYQMLPPTEYVMEFSTNIDIDSDIDREALSIKLVASGYERTDLVDSIGKFSIKGNIIDIYSPYHDKPGRIELFGDIIESIRFFDASTQRTVSTTKSFVIIPCKEISFSKHSLDLFREKFKEHCDKNHIRKDLREQIIELADNGVYFPGIEYYLPFFHNRTSNIYEYLPKEAEIIFYDEHLFQENFIPEPTEDTIPYPLDSLYLKGRFWEDIKTTNKIKKVYSIEFQDGHETKEAVSFKDDTNDHLMIKNLKQHGPNATEKLKDFHKEKTELGYRLIYTCKTEHQAERLVFILGEAGKDLRLFKSKTINSMINDPQAHSPAICISGLSEGFTIRSKKIWVISEDEIFGEKQKKLESSKTQDAFLNLFKELKLNDYVVHARHGVGIYRGLCKMEIDNIENDYFQIEYADKDMLFLPVYRLSTVQRHVAQGGKKAVLDKLGGLSWNKKRLKAKKATMDIAHKLIKLQSERMLKKGYQFSAPDDLYYRFESEFEFEETDDQLKAINDVISDMESSRPMDRLICGDVGFGKTEVAIRAAFKAARDGKQTAVLAPTTVLAFQHYRIFEKRFRDYPVRINLLTRFKTAKEQKEILGQLEKGTIDIIIGTHRLLSKDIKFSNLGLLIIDEEHRFGVQHKEKMKEMSASTDVITMTATPIPRTLNMSLVGLKDISVITTPPINRLPIKTYVSKFNPKLIRKAVMHEIKRGGQIYFLHNRVMDLEEMHQRLKDILPEAKIITAHGQMNAKELEEKMISFYNKEADILLCTSIIESGIDIPNANTIIINRADTFGLSQLYQIRGRVGRSPARAFCYLLVPSNFMIGKSAIERIKTLQRFTELGSGFNIASYDLEFRGAGEILGSSQSGFIDDIGLEEYLRLIQEAVDEIKGEHSNEEKNYEPEISINIPAFIPEDYVSEISQRLYFYKKLSSINSKQDLSTFKDEIIDRYGPQPEEVDNLFSLIEIKLLLKPLNVSSIKIGAGKLVYSFLNTTKVMPETIVGLVTKQPKKYKITPDMKLISNIGDNDWRSAIKEIKEFIRLEEEKH